MMFPPKDYDPWEKDEQSLDYPAPSENAKFEEYLNVAERSKQMVMGKGEAHWGDVPKVPEDKPIRKFETGATRDTDQGKPDYFSFYSPKVIKRFGEYMNKHRRQPDGSMREADNWKKGIPEPEYVKSFLRHTVDFWDLYEEALNHRTNVDHSLEELACAILFNVQGWLHEHLKHKDDIPF